MYASARILIFGHDAILLKSRCLILEKAGFQVWTTACAADAGSAIFAKTFDLFVLCSSVSDRERGELLTVAHDVQPEMKTLILTDALHAGGLYGRATFADGVMSPDTLLAVVWELAGSQAGDCRLGPEASNVSDSRVYTTPG